MPPRQLGLAALIVLCAAGVEGTPERRDLLLITIDTLRADALGVNGSASGATPNLDKLARGGVNFSRARSPVPLTLPAHASIFTGLYPPEHGVRDNGSFRLADDRQTLAEILSEHGYETAAFVGSFVLDRRFGLQQGFHTYDDRAWSAVEEMESLTAERPAGEIFASFDSWLARRESARPLFAWIHLYDPHAPYQAPEPHRTRYADRPYVGEIAYVDQVVGEILQSLRQQRLLEQTLMAVVGDHGEGLGEHGEGTHSLLIYNSTLHVPMLLNGPGLVPAGRTVDDLVRVIDLPATLLDLLGFETRMGSGVSLRSRFEPGDSQVEPLSAYSETLYPQLQLGWSALRALESAGKKLIVAPRPELYDLRGDPGELENLADTESASYQRLKRDLVELLAAFGDSDRGADLALDTETRQRLRSLGYLSGGGPAASGRPSEEIDPKDRMVEWDRIQAGIAKLAAGNPQGAAGLFEEILQEDPDNLLAYEYLGAAHRLLGDGKTAEEVYRRALERGLESAELHRQLGVLRRQQGAVDEALREMEIARTLDPRSVEAHFEAGQIYRQLGRPKQAADCYRAAIELNSSYLWAWNGLAMVLASTGERDEALKAFERVVQIDPQGAAGYFNLALHLERMEQRSQAVATYQKFLELAVSDDLAPQRSLAREALERLTD